MARTKYDMARDLVEVQIEMTKQRLQPRTLAPTKGQVGNLVRAVDEFLQVLHEREGA